MVFSYPPEHYEHREKETFLGFDSQLLSDILSPKTSLCDRQFTLSIDNITFIGHATLLNSDRPGGGNKYARAIQRRRSPDVQLTMFNLVLAAGSKAGTMGDMIYSHIISKITASLKYEQLKRNYVRKEADLVNLFPLFDK